MPVLLSERVLTLEFTDLLARRPLARPDKPPIRTPGYHQSGILAHVARSIGKLRPIDEEEENEIRLKLKYPWRWAMGVMFEEFYFSCLPDSIWQPGEFTLDGVSGTPDGLGTYTNEELGLFDLPCLDETKCTEKKVRSGEEMIEDEWMYMAQGKGYCYGYGIDIVRWAVLFYRGDWRGSGPVCKEYTIRFTEQEIERNWRMIVNNKEGAERES